MSAIATLLSFLGISREAWRSALKRLKALLDFLDDKPEKESGGQQIEQNPKNEHGTDLQNQVPKQWHQLGKDFRHKDGLLWEKGNENPYCYYCYRDTGQMVRLYPRYGPYGMEANSRYYFFCSRCRRELNYPPPNAPDKKH
ncbi:MAG: hypothetical protein GX410_01750 [Elusimicrobia bacterium]|nr:hypothetical protein [Elusimicrobiota bacterium]